MHYQSVIAESERLIAEARCLRRRFREAVEEFRVVREGRRASGSARGALGGLEAEATIGAPGTVA